MYVPSGAVIKIHEFPIYSSVTDAGVGMG